MKLTFVIDSLGAGGAERILSVLANRFDADGAEVSIITFNKTEQKPFYKLNEGVQLINISFAVKRSFFLLQVLYLPIFILKLRKALLATRPTTAISFMDQANILTALAAFRSGIRVIVSERVYPDKSSVFEWSSSSLIRRHIRLLRDWSYMLGDKIVVLSKTASQCYNSRLARKIVVIPNPVQRYEEDAADVAFQPKTILMMGRLTEQKNFKLAIRAFASLSETYSDWQLLIVGDGPLKGALKEETLKLGISERVSFVRYTKTPQALMEQAELFILSSSWEGFPNALAEAMLMGKAVLSTDCPTGPGDLINDGKNGLLVPVDDLRAFKTALERLLDDDKLRTELGKSAKESVGRFSPELIFDKWKALL